MAGKALRWRPSVVVSGGSCRYVPVKWAYCSDLYTCRAFLLCLFSDGMAAVSTRTTAVIHIVRRPSTALLTAARHPQTNCKAIIKTKECRDNFVVVYFTFKQNEPISGRNSRAVPCPIGVAGPFYVLRPKAV